MGLFDRFKKQKNEAAEALKATEAVQETEAAKEEVSKEKEAEEISTAKAEPSKAAEETETAKAEVQEAVSEPTARKKEAVNQEAKVQENKAEAKENRRFTLLVESLSALPEAQGVVVGGNLYGTVQVGDEIYIIHPMGNIITTKVDGIEVGPNQTSDKAENQKVTILLRDIKEVEQVPKYTVLTSIKPQTTVDTRVAVENPQLLGMSMDYPRLCRDNTYMNLMIYVLCHAHYVVPTSVDQEPVQTGEETATIQQNTRVRFPALQNPADKSKNVFPIFTDWTALANWKNLFDETHPPKSVIMRFPDVVAVSNGSGVVINAFGPTPILLTEALIEQIVGMEGYKQEFGSNAAEAVKKMQMEQDAKVMVGVPKENDEIKLIKEAMLVQAEKEKEIQRVDFLLKVDVQKERAYLCIVDCPEEKATQLFSAIHKAVAPYLNDVKRLEFLLYGKTQLAKDVVSEKSCIYQA